jgi:hypothetical protein
MAHLVESLLDRSRIGGMRLPGVAGRTLVTYSSPPPYVFTSPSVRSSPPEVQPVTLSAFLLPSLP